MAKGTSTIQMYTTTVGAAAASIDMQDDGNILGCHLEGIVSGLAADLDGFQIEVGFGSTSQFATNDARNVIASIFASTDFGTAVGFVRTDKSVIFEYGEGLPFFGGERIYMHTGNLGATGVLQRARALLIIEFKGGPVSRRR